MNAWFKIGKKVCASQKALHKLSNGNYKKFYSDLKSKSEEEIIKILDIEVNRIFTGKTHFRSPVSDEDKEMYRKGFYSNFI